MERKELEINCKIQSSDGMVIYPVLNGNIEFIINDSIDSASVSCCIDESQAKQIVEHFKTQFAWA